MTGEKQRVAVFGGSGFLGRVVVKRLSAAGYAVRLVARRPAAALASLGAEAAGAVEAVVADIRDPQATAAAVRDVTGVVNAVGLYHESGDHSFAAVHEEGAFALAVAACQAGVGRLVHISGIGVDQRSPSSYVRARAVGEESARAGFPDLTILRPSALFGPDGGLLVSLDALTRALPVFPLFGAGAMRLQPVHVADVAEAVLQAFRRPETAGRTFELGGPESLTYREIVELVLRSRGRRRLLLPVPLGIWSLLARLMAPLPSPPVTVHQLALLANDNVVGSAALSLADLGLVPRPMSDCLPADLTPAP